jgi:hypothetical protein
VGARWAILLSEFDFRIEVLPGKDNEPADALSRSFEKESEIVHEECWNSVASADLVSATQTLVGDDTFFST